MRRSRTQHDIAADRHAQPRARRRTIHQHHQRLFHPRKPRQRQMQRPRQFAQQGRDVVPRRREQPDIAACAKQPPRAGQHDTPDRRIGLAPDRRRDQRMCHRQVDRIARIGPVQRDPRNAVRNIEKDRIAHRNASMLCTARSTSLG